MFAGSIQQTVSTDAPPLNPPPATPDLTQPTTTQDQTPAAQAEPNDDTKPNTSTDANTAQPPEQPTQQPAQDYLYTFALSLKGLTAPTQVRVEATDEDGTRVIHDEQHSNLDRITLNVTSKSLKVVIRTYYDDKLVSTVTKKYGKGKKH